MAIIHHYTNLIKKNRGWNHESQLTAMHSRAKTETKANFSPKSPMHFGKTTFTFSKILLEMIKI